RLLGGQRADHVAQPSRLGERGHLARDVDDGGRPLAHRPASAGPSAAISRRYWAASSGGVGLMWNPEPISKPATRVRWGMISRCQWVSSRSLSPTGEVWRP